MWLWIIAPLFVFDEISTFHSGHWRSGIELIVIGFMLLDAAWFVHYKEFYWKRFNWRWPLAVVSMFLAVSWLLTGRLWDGIFWVAFGLWSRAC